MAGAPVHLTICQRTVDLPTRPYRPQVATITRVLRCVSSGHSALIESATGTGKTRALLCASLAALAHSDVPRVFYCTRTHAQVQQVIDELRRTSYAPSLTVLAGRERLCRVSACGGRPPRTCDKCAHSTDLTAVHRCSAALGGVWDVPDLEDAARRCGACAYAVAQSLVPAAQLVVCPYAYVMDPVARKAMCVDLKGSLVVVDEAHNAESALESSASVDVDVAAIDDVRAVASGSRTAPSLAKSFAALCAWADSLALKPVDFDVDCRVVDGADFCKVLADSGVDDASSTALKEELIALETDRVGSTGSDAWESVPDVERFLSVCALVRSCSGLGYVAVLSRRRRVVAGLSRVERSLGVWCLSPAVPFASIASVARSVVLASGTLSPLDSLALELGAPFEERAELGHVVDVGRQVHSCVVASVGSVTYRTVDSHALQDEAGRVLAAVCRAAPAGVVCFFASHSVLERMCARWRQTGAWSELQRLKPRGLFSERPSTTAADFAATLASERPSTTAADFAATLASYRSAAAGGALLLAVCRGRASEGVNLPDEAARAVVVVGVPFASTRDLRVSLKRAHNDARAPRVPSGEEWYTAQAVRAVCQAAGRAVRHRWDYGAVVLADERYSRDPLRQRLSSWMRETLAVHRNASEAEQALGTFYAEASKYVALNAPGGCGSPAGRAGEEEARGKRGSAEAPALTPSLELLLRNARKKPRASFS
eukprot:m51a1_g11702 hypothetical protein (716) ;mRNA; r:40285-42580